MTDKKKDDIGRAENIAVVEQMPALLERNLAKLPHYELKQRIAEVKSEAAESRAKLTLKIKEVREKKELLKATKKSLLADIRALAQVERDAIDTVEELKSEIAIKNAMRAIK
ncbi:uncharacterized protein LOC119563326 isoform X2 [Drosophila subpulchrella]|uniref:uncharacterized protein LOC119563326 isoform X2 n=1 Tax=Drosophila subpulchrella TaxID=1486046 RepID=UPI0018A12789|nr:uncharacterized protein LOC119563326 isoform X2 [Drosophila subpulchrella]